MSTNDTLTLVAAIFMAVLTAACFIGAIAFVEIVLDTYAAI